MDETEIKVLRCHSESALIELIDHYQSLGWVTTGKTDVFDDVYVQSIKIVRNIDPTEDVTQDTTLNLDNVTLS